MGETIAPVEHLQFFKKEKGMGCTPRTGANSLLGCVLLSCCWQANKVTFTPPPPFKTPPLITMCRFNFWRQRLDFAGRAEDGRLWEYQKFTKCTQQRAAFYMQVFESKGPNKAIANMWCLWMVGLNFSPSPAFPSWFHRRLHCNPGPLFCINFYDKEPKTQGARE